MLGVYRFRAKCVSDDGRRCRDDVKLKYGFRGLRAGRFVPVPGFERCAVFLLLSQRTGNYEAKLYGFFWEGKEPAANTDER